jgi:hypothetical protein
MHAQCTLQRSNNTLSDGTEHANEWSLSMNITKLGPGNLMYGGEMCENCD